MFYRTVAKYTLKPVQSIKRQYIPLLMVYFSFGAQALTAVAMTFWQKDVLVLSAEQIISVSAWITLPWTAKMIVGQLVDVMPLFRSRRKSWVYLGAIIMGLGYAMLYAITQKPTFTAFIGDQFTQYLCAYVIVSIGYMIQDVAADAMSTEVVDRSQPASNIKKELAMIQVLSRLSLMLGAALMAGIGGWLASTLEYEQVFLCALVIPLISVLGVSFVTLNTDYTPASFNPSILWGGITFILFIVVVSASGFRYQQEGIFIGSFIILSFMLSRLLSALPTETKKVIIMGFAALFAFQAIPIIGPGYNWWAIDTLGFNEVFLGTLSQVGGIVAIIVLWIFADFIAKSPVKSILLLLIVLNAFFQLPNLALFYGLHDMAGISAKTVALFDSALDTPLSHIIFIPILAFIAYHAPQNSRATWFAVAASMMNLALMAKQIGSKYLNQIFVVTREVKDSSNTVIVAQDYLGLGNLLWIVLLLGIVIPCLAMYPLYRRSSL